MNQYSYPSIFTYDEDGISIEFPDVPGCYSCAKTKEKALESAQEALSLHLYGMEKDNDPIPEATEIEKVKLEENQEVYLIQTRDISNEVISFR